MDYQNKNYVIGVDGGGTKTVAALANLDGKILKIKTGGSTNWHDIGEKLTKINLERLLKCFFEKYNIQWAVFGFAGLDTKEDLLVYQKIVRSILPKRVKFALYNDTKVAIEALPEEKVRVIIISGTGSNIYGEYKNRTAKAGGYDFLLSDEGSAYWFGMEAIKLAIRSYDGRSKRTIIEKLVLQKDNLKDIPSLIDKIYQLWREKREGFKAYIASFAPILTTAYLKGDKAAKEIIKRGAQELFLGTAAVIRKLKASNQPICIGFVGSNFKSPMLQKLLSFKIKKAFKKVYFVKKVEPEKGAVKLALKYITSES